MAIVATITSGFSMLTDIGLAPNIVRSNRGDDWEFLNTAWTVQVIRGAIVTAAVISMAWPLAAFYGTNDPLAWDLRWIIPLVALGILIDSFQSINVQVAARHLNLARVTILQLGSQVIGISVMILLAWQTQSVYAMPIGGVVTASVQCALSYLILPGKINRFRWEREAVLELFNFGKWIMLSTMIFFLSMQIDKLIFAKIFTLADVGVYSIAASLAILPLTLIGKLQSSIVFPLYSRLIDHGEHLPNIVRRTKAPVLLVAAYLVSSCIACAESFTAAAYNESYAVVGIYMPILVVGTWFGTIGGSYTSAFMAVGRSSWVAIANFSRLVIFCLSLVPAIYFHGFIGAVIMVAAAELFKLPLIYYFANRLKILDIKMDMLLSILVSVLGVGTVFLTKWIFVSSNLHPLALMIIQFTFVSLVFAPLIIRVARSFKSLGNVQ